jgi:geranylgeranylglycerol-phosphate geranylgeranyltransferase
MVSGGSFLTKILALYRLARPFNALTGALAVFLGGYVAGTGEWEKVAMAAVVTFLVTGAGNSWNDYLDVEIDKINQPQRVLPSGQVDPRAAWILSVVLTVIALIIAAFINPAAFIVAFLASAILFIYSWKLKSTVLMGNATVAAISALSVIFGGIAAGNVRPTLILAAIVGVAILGREVLKTLADYEGDLQERVRTVATTWGRRLCLYRGFRRLSNPDICPGKGDPLFQRPAIGKNQPVDEDGLHDLDGSRDSWGIP